jgi:hypothetical protein
MKGLVCHGNARARRNQTVTGTAELPKSTRAPMGFLLVAGSNSQKLEAGKAGIRETESRRLEQ